MSLDNKNIENPYFIIAAGPTASGKSTITQKISQYIMNNELLDINKTIFISVDDYIEKNPYFFSQVDNYFKKNFKNKKQDLYKEFINPSKKTIIFFNKIYWETRKNIDCVTGKKITKQDKNYKTCGQIISNNILNALKKKKNIIFETTGVNFPFWIFKQYPNNLINYNLIIAWSIVDICDLYGRNKFRTLSNVKSFIETYTDNAPRLPDIRKKNYKRNLISIIETYNLLVKYHGNRSLSKLRLLLFDNRDRKNNILYDSYKNSDKTGYKEILKYNIHKNCEISNSKKSSLKSNSNKKSPILSSKSNSNKESPILSSKSNSNKESQILSSKSNSNKESQILSSKSNSKKRSKPSHKMVTRSKQLSHNNVNYDYVKS